MSKTTKTKPKKKPKKKAVEKVVEPEQSPELIPQPLEVCWHPLQVLWHEPITKDRFFEVKVPVTWEEIMGDKEVSKVKTMLVANKILDIVDSLHTEYMSRHTKTQAEVDEAKAKQKEANEARRLTDRTAAIIKIIEEEPDVVKAKRKEFGEDVLDDKAAAAVIYQERQDPPEKPKKMPKSAKQKKADTKAIKDYTPDDLPEGDFGEKVRFYRSEFGWSMYLDSGKEEDMVPILFEWLVSIPMEVRHRKGDKYPCISHSGKFIMVNDYEKEFITTAAENAEMEVIIKED